MHIEGSAGADLASDGSLKSGAVPVQHLHGSHISLDPRSHSFPFEDDSPIVTFWGLSGALAAFKLTIGCWKFLRFFCFSRNHVVSGGQFIFCFL
jgi:hypothetical protein